MHQLCVFHTFGNYNSLKLSLKIIYFLSSHYYKERLKKIKTKKTEKNKILCCC